MSNVVLAFSGGVKSTAVLYELIRAGDRVKGIVASFGASNRREVECALDIARDAHIPVEIADLSSVRRFLQPHPKGQEMEDAEDDGQAVGRDRHSLILSLAWAWAISTKSQFVACGLGYDAGLDSMWGRAFVRAFDDLYATQSPPVRLLRPYAGLSLPAIVRRGQDLRAPFEITWSCARRTKDHCGQCPGCAERRQAFQVADVADPTIYKEP